jgi:DNA-binding beta-propeller fold protein YncE
VDNANNIYVSDSQNSRVQKFGSQGNFLMSWGSPGAGIGQFNEPNGVTSDTTGRVYVSDVLNNRIQVFMPGVSTVIPIPTLSISMSGPNSVLLAWPSASSGFLLQQSSSLAAGSWTTLTNIPSLSGSQFQIVLTPLTGSQFFRLVK